MRFRDLSPQFLHWTADHNFTFTDDITEADGVQFYCPCCLATGSFLVLLWFSTGNVPATEGPELGRWMAGATSYDDVTLTPDVVLRTGCMGRFSVDQGEVTLLP